MVLESRQKNITLTEDQQRVIKQYHGTMHLRKICNMIGVKYNKVHNNLKLMGMVQPKVYKSRQIETGEYFNERDFFKHYQY